MVLEGEYDIRELIGADNIAGMLTDKELSHIGSEAKRGFEVDQNSRQGWLDKTEEWMKLATQVCEPKNFPWPGAANVRYPLITLAAVQFHARAYPNLVPPSRLVNAMVVGKDPDGTKAERAQRIAKHMSWQLLEKMKTWEPEMDKALLVTPIVGCVFKKTYYDPIRQVNKSEIILPKFIAVDYWAKDIDEAHRITQILEMSSNDIHSYQKSGLFLDVDLPNDSPRQLEKGFGDQVAPDSNDIGIHNILEQHTWLDLDGDSYKEPYIVTIHEPSGKVLRIKARYTEDQVFVNDKSEVIYIDPIRHFTKFSFIPNPDGGFYDIGFGLLLGPINSSCDTIINQLLDAGTLSNTQGGFIGRGLRIKEGTLRFRPNEWKVVNASGNDIARSIFPLPVREPSGVSFSLLSLLLDAGQRLSSTVDIMVGQTPGQNTPATTTMVALEQGGKVFTAIYKRLYNALKSEFRKLFYLNSIYLSEQEYYTVLDDDKLTAEAIGVRDYTLEDFDVIPAADPSVASDMINLAKAQGLMELLPLGTVNPMEATRRILEAQKQENIQAIITMPPPQPDPAAALEQAKLEMEQTFKQRDFDIKQQQVDIQRASVLAQIDKNEAERALTEAKSHAERAKGAGHLHQILSTLPPQPNEQPTIAEPNANAQ